MRSKRKTKRNIKRRKTKRNIKSRKTKRNIKSRKTKRNIKSRKKGGAEPSKVLHSGRPKYESSPEIEGEYQESSKSELQDYRKELEKERVLKNKSYAETKKIRKNLEEVELELQELLEGGDHKLKQELQDYSKELDKCQKKLKQIDIKNEKEIGQLRNKCNLLLKKIDGEKKRLDQENKALKLKLHKLLNTNKYSIPGAEFTYELHKDIGVNETDTFAPSRPIMTKYPYDFPTSEIKIRFPQGAVKGQRFKVTVFAPFKNIIDKHLTGEAKLIGPPPKKPTPLPRNPTQDVKKYYSILEIPLSATQNEIKQAYRKLALIHHPDKGGDEHMFKLIGEAHDVLSDPDKKDIYDKFGE